MPRTYSNNEYADMIYLYRFCDGNANTVRREYAAQFSNRLRQISILFKG